MKQETKKRNTAAGRAIRRCAAVCLPVALLFGAGCASAVPSAPTIVAAETYATVVPTVSPAPTVTPEPFFAAPGYFPMAGDRFEPERAITVSEAEMILASAVGKTAEPISENPMDEDALETCIAAYFSDERAHDAVEVIRGMGGSEVTRAEAAVCFNRLFGFSPSDEGAYCPDVSPEHWAYRDILTAAERRDIPRLAEGFFVHDGELYCADERGYLLKNAYEGSLFFAADGRYTSGDAELDALVTKAIREQTDPSMGRDAMLRAMYEHIRDDFTYLRGNYYRMGEADWAQTEARNMFSSGRGNCYGYAAAFCAAARALGYEAQVVSGLYGEHSAPHGWVEIRMSGVRYTYDVEIEMVNLRDNDPSTDFYAMIDKAREDHYYEEYDYTDAAMPRDSVSGVFQR